MGKTEEWYFGLIKVTGFHCWILNDSACFRMSFLFFFIIFHFPDCHLDCSVSSGLYNGNGMTDSLEIVSFDRNKKSFIWLQSESE